MRLISISLLLGTIAIQWSTEIVDWRILLAILSCLIVLTFLKWKRSVIYRKIIVVISVFLIGLSIASYQANKILSDRLAKPIEGMELVVRGRVVNIPSVKEDGVRFLLEVKDAQIVDEFQTSVDLSGIIRLGWFKHQKQINAGESWQLKVKLKQPSGFMNPGGFDYEKWLFTQGIIATGYVRKDQKVNTRLSEAQWYSIDQIRQNIHQRIQLQIDNKPSAAVLSALLVAVRTTLSDQQWQLFQDTGTSHLIAISGLHIAVVAGFAFFPMMILWRMFPRLNERIPLAVAAAVVGVIFATLYALLAGFTLPTQRALLMVIIGLWGLVSRRNYDSFTILSFALIGVLLFDPLASLTISFWLSFLAVLLILIFIKRQNKKPKWMVLKLQVFLSLAMLPLTMLFFDTAPILSPVANLFAIPWISFVVVPISLIALVMMPISKDLSNMLLEFSSYLIQWFINGLELLEYSPLSKFNPIDIPNVPLILAFIGLLYLFLPRGFPARFLGIILLYPAISYQPSTLNKGEFEYNLLDVGQGYASVLHTQNHHLVYDAGIRVSDSFDLGKLVVGPYLRSKGVKDIDMLMISHEDIDHRGGAQFLQEHFSVFKVISSDTNSLANSTECLAGQRWQWDGVSFEVLSPSEGFDGNDNNSSCVLKIYNQHHSLLLTGDIQKFSEHYLIKTQASKLKAEVMAVPHHGSKTSSSKAFISHVSPKIALISAGYNSRFGHPKKEVVERYQEQGIELLDTVKHGAIKLRFPTDDSEIKHNYFRIENRGFWNR